MTQSCSTDRSCLRQALKLKALRLFPKPLTALLLTGESMATESIVSRSVAFKEANKSRVRVRVRVHMSCKENLGLLAQALWGNYDAISNNYVYVPSSNTFMYQSILPVAWSTFILPFEIVEPRTRLTISQGFPRQHRQSDLPQTNTTR